MRIKTVKFGRSLATTLLILAFSAGVQAAGSSTLSKCLNKVANDCAGYTGWDWMDCIETGEQLCKNQEAAKPKPIGRKPLNGSVRKVKAGSQ